MNKQNNDKIRVFKPVFGVLLILDLVGLIFTCIFTASTFKTMKEYGQIMLIVTSVFVLVMAAVSVFKILTKIFFIRSASPAFSWPCGCKKYIAAARLLWVFNLFAIFFSVLAIGGEGATLLNQAYLYLRMAMSLAEMIAAIFYLRTVKKVFADKIETAE